MESLFGASAGGRAGSRRVIQTAADRLQRRLRLASRQVTCHCSRGTLMLRGQLPTYYQKQLAQEAVKGLDGVVEIINEIEVST